MYGMLRRFVVGITLLFSAWFFAFYGKESYPFNGDAMGYYMYLPSTFIYHNLKALDWLPEDHKFDYRVRFYLSELRREGLYTPAGYLIDKYTYGVAALELPFFLAAHAYEKLIGGNPDGYSASYVTAVWVATFFYAFAGLLLLYHILARLYSKSLAVAGTVLIFTGTNLFWFTVGQAGMAHVPLFFLYSLLLYTTMLLHERPRKWLFVFAGLAAGAITIIRPTDIICLLIPLLYNVYDSRTVRAKLQFLRGQLMGVLLFTVSFVVPLLPQMVYWKKFAGSFLYYSYSKETFHWNDPHIADGLFSFGNGWFVYTPLMLVALAGLVCYRRMKPTAWTTWLILPVYVYVVYSWHCYNYINGLGSRPMIHLYPLLAIPLTALLQWALSRGTVAKATLAGLVVLFSAVNISYSIQQAKGILFSEESNATYNLNMLFHTRATYADLVMMDVKEVQPSERQLQKVATLVCVTHEDSNDHHIPDPTGQSRFVFRMPAGEEYYRHLIKVPYSKAVFGNARYIKCSGRFSCPQHYTYYKHLLKLDIITSDKRLLWWGCRIDNKIGLTEANAPLSEFHIYHCDLNKWGRIWFYVPIPAGLEEGDLVRLDIWNIGWQEMLLDDICLELYR